MTYLRATYHGSWIEFRFLHNFPAGVFEGKKSLLYTFSSISQAVYILWLDLVHHNCSLLKLGPKFLSRLIGKRNRSKRASVWNLIRCPYKKKNKVVLGFSNCNLFTKLIICGIFFLKKIFSLLIKWIFNLLVTQLL